MKLTIAINNEEYFFKQIKTDWNHLLRDSRANTIFLTWEWMSTWWTVYGHNYQLYLLTAENSDGQLLGVAPLKISNRKYFFKRKISTLEFIGFGEDVTPEYLDFIIRKDYEKVITKLFLDYILSDNNIDALDLKPFAVDSINISFIKSYMAKKKTFYKISEHSICPVISLPDSWDNFILSKSKNFRKKMKEYSRICDRDLNLKFTQCNSLKELESGMNQLIELHNNRWKGLSQAFKTERYVTFHKLLSELFLKKNWLRLFFLTSETKPIAGIYCFYYNNQYYYYQSGRDLEYSKYRVGLVSINKSIEQAINEGAILFDLLTGDESYKFRWADGVRKSVRIIYWSNSFKNIFSRFFYTVRRLLFKTS